MLHFLLNWIEEHKSDTKDRFVFLLCARGLQETWAAKYLGSRRQLQWRSKARKMRKAGRWAGSHTRFVLDHLLQCNFSHPRPQIWPLFNLEKWGASHFWLVEMPSFSTPVLAPRSYAPLGRWLEKVSALWAVPLSLPSAPPDGLSPSQRADSTDWLHFDLM